MLRRQYRLGLSFAVIAIAFAFGAAGCDAILGIHDVEPDTTGGAGGGTGGTTSSTGGNTGGTTTNPTGGGGTGGSTIDMGDFAFAATSPTTDLPISGQAFLGVQISPMNGFLGEVTISLKLPPSDVTFEGVTLPSGELAGAVKIGAKQSATLGQMFNLTLVATSGKLTHEATVQGVVTGTPGTLVDTFGVAGIASWTLAMDDGNVYDMREVAQNKILTTGDHLPGLSSFLKGARVLPTGTMDLSFGPNGDGTITQQFCGCSKPSVGRGVVRLLNGNILMIGTGNKGAGFNDDIALLRLKDDGTPDNVGGDAGKALIDLGDVDQASAIELTSDERIVTVGTTGSQGFAARLDPGGFLDNTFGGGSLFVLPFSGSVKSEANAVALDAQGRVLVTGRMDVGGGNYELGVRRLTASGVIDGAWNGGATAVYGGTGEQAGIGVGLQSDGKIVVVGRTSESGQDSVVVLRFLDNGTADTTFGAGGKTIVTPGAGGDSPADMAILSDGRILVAGNNGGGPFVMRFLADGTPDPTFGAGGVKSIFLGNQGNVQSIAIGAAGRILLGGRRETQPVKGFVAKVWN